MFTLFIQMAPGAASTDLPVSLYESVIDMVNLQVIEWLVITLGIQLWFSGPV